MKPGDLVCLSAYGMQRRRAAWIDPEDVGIVVKVIQYSSNYPPDYRVRWVKSEYNRHAWHDQRDNIRKDLKHVR